MEIKLCHIASRDHVIKAPCKKNSHFVSHRSCKKEKYIFLPMSLALIRAMGFKDHVTFAMGVSHTQLPPCLVL